MQGGVKWPLDVVSKKTELERLKAELCRVQALKLGYIKADLSNEEDEKKMVKHQTAAKIQLGPVDTADFMKGAMQANLKVVEKYLADGGNPNVCDKFSKIALHRASIEGHTVVIHKVLERGADITLKDRAMSSPLHVATRTGHTDVLWFLISNSIDVNDREGHTALHDAVRLNRYKIVHLLIMDGADMRIQNYAGVRVFEE